MRSVLLIQMDGKFPNLALMRISAHHKSMGDAVTLRHIGNIDSLEREPLHLYNDIYASLIFKWNRPVAERLCRLRPDAIIGGTGWDIISTGIVNIRARQQAAFVTRLEDFGIDTEGPRDYSIYPNETRSFGFTQRGCRMGCEFCHVPVTEGKVRATETIERIWRGGDAQKNLIIWDNDTFGSPIWRQTFEAIRDGGYKVSFNQGVNCRLMNEENAEVFAATPCYDDDFKTRRWYTAWDNRDDEDILFRGLRYLTKYGVKPDQIMVYMLIGYWPGETHEDREFRRRKLRDFGVRPYPMAFNKHPEHQRRCKCDDCLRRRELVGFQRWVMWAFDKKVPWSDWKANNYRMEGLGLRPSEKHDK